MGLPPEEDVHRYLGPTGVAFPVKSSYESERASASTLGWSLLNELERVPQDQLWISTALYIARTVCLTRLAEKSQPVPAFSKADMCEAIGMRALSQLWEYKHLAKADFEASNALEEVLEQQGSKKPSWFGQQNDRPWLRLSGYSALRLRSLILRQNPKPDY